MFQIEEEMEHVAVQQAFMSLFQKHKKGNFDLFCIHIHFLKTGLSVLW